MLKSSDFSESSWTGSGMVEPTFPPPPAPAPTPGSMEDEPMRAPRPKRAAKKPKKAAKRPKAKQAARKRPKAKAKRSGKKKKAASKRRGSASRVARAISSRRSRGTFSSPPSQSPASPSPESCRA